MPVRVSRDHRLFDSYPELIAVFHALRSLLMPRHPPYALSNLTTKIKRSREQPLPSGRGYSRGCWRLQTRLYSPASAADTPGCVVTICLLLAFACRPCGTKALGKHAKCLGELSDASLATMHLLIQRTCVMRRRQTDPKVRPSPAQNQIVKEPTGASLTSLSSANY
jgi:hypothetical protein